MDIDICILVFIFIILVAFAYMLFMYKYKQRSITGGSDDTNYIMGKNIFDKMKIGQFINAGQFGSIYKIRVNNKDYALKRGRYNKDVSTNIYDILDVLKTLQKHANEYFPKIHAARIIPCNYIYDTNSINDEVLDLRNALKKSGKCLDVVTDYYDIKLKDVLLNKKTPRKELINIAQQLVKSIHYSYTHGILLNDAHVYNVMYHDHHIVHIDFDNWIFMGNINKYTKEEQKILAARFDINWDLLFVIKTLCMSYLNEFNGLKTSMITINDLVNNIKLSGDYESVMNYLHNIYRYSDEKSLIDLEIIDKWDYAIVEVIWMIVSPENFSKFVNKMFKKVTIYEPIISNNKLRYILDNYWDMEKIISYISK